MCNLSALTVSGRLEEWGNGEREREKEGAEGGEESLPVTVQFTLVQLCLCMLTKAFRDFRLAGGAKEETEVGSLFNIPVFHPVV